MYKAHTKEHTIDCNSLLARQTVSNSYTNCSILIVSVVRPFYRLLQSHSSRTRLLFRQHPFRSSNWQCPVERIHIVNCKMIINWNINWSTISSGLTTKLLYFTSFVSLNDWNLSSISSWIFCWNIIASRSPPSFGFSWNCCKHVRHKLKIISIISMNISSNLCESFLFCFLVDSNQISIGVMSFWLIQ